MILILGDLKRLAMLISNLPYCILICLIAGFCEAPWVTLCLKQSSLAPLALP